jgi:hypothetical protein
MGAVITQGGTNGVLAAALGTPVVVVAPPDTPFYPEPIAGDQHYRTVREPLAFVREGVAKTLAALAIHPHDGAKFRERAALATDTADLIARAALDLTYRRKKARPARTVATRNAPPAAVAASDR